MPVYEYACTTCGERTEARQSFDDPPLEECPICGGPLRKLYSPVGIVFKGSGFYSTESKRDSRAGRDGQAAASSNSDKAGKRKEGKGAEGGSGSGDSSGAAAGSTTGSPSGSGSGSGSGGTKTSDKSG
jgi:putative FmdB family regulatory protein